MNIKEIDSKILFKEFEVQVPYKEVDNSINAKIAEIIPTVSLPGFRKGKAPLNIVKKKYENNVLSEVIEKLVEDKTKKLLEEKKLKAFRQPRVEIKKYEKKIDYWASEKDRGLYDAFNKGMSVARGNFIGIINSGDIYTKNSLRIISKYIKR